MGSCFSSIVGGGDRKKAENGAKEAAAFPEEDEDLVVKEVLSESTPNPFLSASTIVSSSEAAGPVAVAAGGGGRGDDTKNETAEELDGSVEMCQSMSETVSAVSTFTERDGIDETEEEENSSFFNRMERRRVVSSSSSSSVLRRRCSAEDNKHPSPRPRARTRARTRTLSGEIPDNIKAPRSRSDATKQHPNNKAPARGRTSPSPSRTRSSSRGPKQLNSGGNGVGRVGVRSTSSSADKKQYRRSVSPAPKKKTDGVEGRSNIVIGSGEKALKSADQVEKRKLGPTDVVEKRGLKSPAADADAAEEEDSVDNPLVSLECFIFL